jgi:cytochrome c oxidase subunit II
VSRSSDFYTERVSYRSSTPLLRRMLLVAPLVIVPLLPAPALAASGLDPLLPQGVSPNGRNLYDLYNIISIPAIVVFLLVEGLLLTIIIRDRRKRRGPDYRPPQWHGNTRLEIVWTVLPFLLLVGIGALSFNELQRDFQRPTDAATDLDITVSAHQFGWTYAYPEGFAVTSEGLQAASNPMIVPTGKLVRLKLQAEDVIHGFWIPDIAGKTDAVPGYDNYTWFKIDQPGEWRGECTELCGDGHATMQIRVRAVSQSDFDAWVAEQKAKAAGPSPSPSASASPSPSASASQPSASPSPSPSASARPSPSPSS